MPKRNSERIERITVRVQLSATSSGAGIATYPLSPDPALAGSVGAVSTKLAAMADLFQYYRLTRGHIKIYPGGGGVSAAIGLASGDIDNPPTGFASVVALPWSAPSSGTHTVFLNYDLPSKLLRGQLLWYKTILSGTTDDQLEVPAVLFGNGTASAQIVCWGEFDFEFKNFIGATQNPMRRDPEPVPLPAPLVHIDNWAPPSDTLSEAKSEVVWVKRQK